MGMPGGGPLEVAGPAHRPRQLFRLAGSIGALPEDEVVIRAIGLKNDALTVAGPNRKPIVRAPERQPARRAGAAQVVDPDVSLAAIERDVGELLAVRRDARR